MSLHDSTKKLQKGFDDVVNYLDKAVLRTFYKDIYLQLSKCYDSSTHSNEEVKSCTEKYSYILSQVNGHVHQEVNSFGYKVQRCLEVCQDEKSLLKESFSNKDRCEISCMTKHTDMLKPFQGKLEKDLKDLIRR